MGTAIASFEPGKVPRIIYNTRLPFSIVEKIDSVKLQTGMNTLLDEALGQMVKFLASPKGNEKITKNISSVLVTFSSPWFISKTKHIQVTKDKPFLITKAFFENLINDEEDIFEKELLGDLPQHEKSFNIIEKNIVHIKINGYDIHSAVGKKAKNLDAFLCLSVIGSSVAKQVNDLILKHTHVTGDKIMMHTFPLVSFSVVRDMYPTFSDFILMDITGEVTDLTLVKSNVITETVSFPSGRNFIVRQISKAFDVSPEIALSTLHMCVDGKADDDMVNKMQELLNTVEKEWSIYMEDAITSISKDAVLPSRVYITSDKDVSSIFINFLQLSKTDNTYAFRKNIDVVYVDHQSLEKLYKSESMFSGDEFMAILAIFYSKFMRHR
jgi:hypothetical protein